MWTTAGSPYIVTGSVSVVGTQTVEQGVVVRFDAGTDLTVPFGACLQVLGTAEAPVLFTANQTNASPGAWNGIKIINSYLANSIANAVVEYASDGLYCVGANDGLGVLSASNVTVRHCSGNGVHAVGSGSSLYSLWDGWARIYLHACNIYSNSQCGVFLAASSPWADGWLEGSIDHCVIANNAGDGMQMYGSGVVRPSIVNSLVYANTGSGILNQTHLASIIENNILVSNGAGIAQTSSTNLLNTSFNDVWGNGTNWVGFDASYDPAGQNNISVDPLFANPAIHDFHLRSQAGRFNPETGTWTADLVTSPCIDAGDLHSSFIDEPQPNGRRINLGIHGNTIEASKSPDADGDGIPDSWTQWYFGHPTGQSGDNSRSGDDADGDGHPNLSEFLGGSSPLDSTNTPVQQLVIPTSHDFGGVRTGATLSATFSVINTGVVALTGNAAVADPFAVSYGTPYSVMPGQTGDVTVTFAPEALAHYTNFVIFASDGGTCSNRVTGSGRTTSFYVNDASTNLDEWCTSPGDDSNDGLDPATPKASVQSVLATHTLQGGDVVFIDTGSYSLTNDIVVGPPYGELPVTFAASPYGVEMSRAAAPSSCGWDITANYVTLTTASGTKHPSMPQRWMTVTGADCGIRVFGYGCHVSKCTLASNATYGVFTTFGYSGNTLLTLENLLVVGPTTDGIAQWASYGNIKNCTIVGCRRGISGNGNLGNAGISNCIISVSGSGAYVFEDVGWSGAHPLSDHNILLVSSGARIGPLGGTLIQWRAATGQDTHSLAEDPSFVAPAAGDYHLQSTAGSYHGGSWSMDPQTSPGIDAGFGDAGNEPLPNSSPLHASNFGARNIGAYGGTEQASKTPAGRCLWLYSPTGGESYGNTNVPMDVSWAWSGTGWADGDTLNMAVSADAGATYQPIPGANAVPVDAATHPWNFAGRPSSLLSRIRLASNQDSATTASLGNFRLGPNIVFYVNDASTELDEWCIAIGGDENIGGDPLSPKPSLQSLLNQYTLFPGDMVRVDTGVYTNIGYIYMSAANSGSSDAPISIIASPYGVTWDGGFSGSEDNFVVAGSNVTLTTASSTKYPEAPQRWATIAGGWGQMGVHGNDCRISRCEFSTGRFYFKNPRYSLGIFGTNTVIENCLIREEGWNRTVIGISLEPSSADTTVRNCTIEGHSIETGIAMLGAGHLQNNIISIAGSWHFAFAGVPTTSDWNNVWVTNGAQVTSTCTNLMDWRTATGGDANSFEADPLFVDPANGDYHLQSTVGSCHGGAWTADPADSPAIDMADPSIPAGMEPAPNGLIANLGAYGTTEQASLSRDSDGDLLSDNFEIRRSGTDPDRPDTDGDLSPDGNELIAATDPLDRLSHFAIASVRYENGEAIIRFPASDERSYLVECSQDLLLWEPLLGQPLVRDNGFAEIHDPASSQQKKFYRARVLW